MMMTTCLNQILYTIDLSQFGLFRIYLAVEAFDVLELWEQSSIIVG